MSKEEQSVKSKIIITSSNDSLNKKGEPPIKTNESMNTESYEYFSQRITTKNNITESSVQATNQKVKNQTLKCTCGQESSSQKKIQEKKCICGLGMTQEKNSKKICTCNCALVQGQKCTCGLSQIKSDSNNQVQIKSPTIETSKYTSGSNTQKITKEKKEKEISVKTGELKCNCNTKVNINAHASNKISLQKISKTSESYLNLEKSKKLMEDWNKRCVGQNNENLQILATEKPELLVQYVQDLTVIQEPKPVQILLPVTPNEIDYPLGLEIYGKEKKVLICPENIENLDVSKAYSTVKPHFDNLDIGQSENIFCDRIQKKEENNNLAKKYEDLTLENGEMFVKGEKDFNKNNEKELTTKMNVVGKEKLSWNETNEAIKTTKMNIDRSERIKFDNLDMENNTYNYKGKAKNKFSNEEINKEQNESIKYPAEFVQKNWNDVTYPMSGKPFTLEKVETNVDLEKSKGEKITLKKAYDTVDWNKKNNQRKEVQINMAKKAKKKYLSKQKIQPVVIKGQENNWNKLVKEQNDTNINIEKTQKKSDFILSKGDEVHISNESDEILINDDYNIVEENYTRPIRANIKKIENYEEESISSEYDVLKGIQKYTGQYQYKNLVNESLQIQVQKVIINDISGKYPRRIESFKGLDENFEKFQNDTKYKTKDKRDFNVELNEVKIHKKIVVSNENEEPEDAPEIDQNQEEENMEIPEDKDHIPEENEEENEEQDIENNNLNEDNSEPKDEMEQDQEHNEESKQEENLKESKDDSPKVYIKEITYTKNEENEQEVAKMRYITLNKTEEQQDTNSHPDDQENEENQKVTPAQYITMESQKVEEQHISKSENEIKSDLDEEIKKEKEEIKNESNVNKYISMLSQKADEQHISRDEGEISNELDEEIKKKEIQKQQEGENGEDDEQHAEGQLTEEVEQHDENLAQGQFEEQNEEHVEENAGEQLEEDEVEEHVEEHLEENEVEEHVEEHVEDNNEEHLEEQVEEHLEEHVEENNEEHVEGQLEEEEVEEHVEEHLEENAEGQLEENDEEHIEENNEEHVEEEQEKAEEQVEQQNLKEEKGQFEEQQKEEIQEKKEETTQKENRINIITNAIKEEMEELEMKKQKEIEIQKKLKSEKYKSLVNNYSKHLKENPIDNINKFETAKLNVMPKVQQENIQIKSQQETNANPMTYSFGQGSAEGSQRGSKSNQYITISKINLNSENNSREIIINSQIKTTGTRMSGKYYFNKSTYSSYSKDSGKEPSDTIKRKMIENEEKAVNENDLAFGPRDSKRKSQ